MNSHLDILKKTVEKTMSTTFNFETTNSGSGSTDFTFTSTSGTTSTTPYSIAFKLPYSTPTQAEFFFSTSLSGSKQICTFYDKFIDTTTASGISIVPLRSIDYAKAYMYPITGEKFTSSYVSNKYVFIGTTYTGITYICDDFIYEDGYYHNYTYQMYNFACDDNITSNNVAYLHCSDLYLLATTTSGVDCYDITTTSGYHYYITSSGGAGKKCFVTNDSAYYITDYNTYEALTVIKDIENNWDTPYKVYDTTPSGLFKDTDTLNDLYVKDNYPDPNIIYCATASGLYEINEYTDFYNIYTSED